MHFGHLLVTFANSLDPDQTCQIVRPDLDTSDGISDFFFFLKSQQVTKRRKSPRMQRELLQEGTFFGCLNDIIFCF